MRERNPISCQGNFIKRELPARWGPGPSTEFQDVPPALGGPPGPCTAFGLLWAQSTAGFTVTPGGRQGREPRQLTLALALASSLHLRLEDLPT